MEALKKVKLERDEAHTAAAKYSDHLFGYGMLVGPCPHGSDPWDRCDTCGDLNAVQVALLLRDAEKDARERAERDEARNAVARTAERLNEGMDMAPVAHEQAEADKATLQIRRCVPPRNCATPTVLRQTGTSWRELSTS